MDRKAHPTAAYKVVRSPNGNQYNFYCELSGIHVCTTHCWVGKDTQSSLKAAWQVEGKPNFNLCHQCGKWVCDAMYNADVLKCVDCAPWENYPEYCPHCGKKVQKQFQHCRYCGRRLVYGGGDADDSL